MLLQSARRVAQVVHDAIPAAVRLCAQVHIAEPGHARTVDVRAKDLVHRLPGRVGREDIGWQVGRPGIGGNIPFEIRKVDKRHPGVEFESPLVRIAVAVREAGAVHANVCKDRVLQQGFLGIVVAVVEIEAPGVDVVEDAAAVARERRLHVQDDDIGVHGVAGVVDAHCVLVYQRRLDQTVAHHQLIREVGFRLAVAVGHRSVVEFAADAVSLEVLDGDVVDQGAFLPCHGDAVVCLEVRVDFAVAPDEHVLLGRFGRVHLAADLDEPVHLGAGRAFQLGVVQFQIALVEHQFPGERIDALREIQRLGRVRGDERIERGQVVGGAVSLEAIVQHVQHPAAACAQGGAIQVVYHISLPPSGS